MPKPPNLAGDRHVEYSWIAAHVPQGPGQALEFGCGQSFLSLIAANRGFSVTAIDLTPVQWFYVHPSLTFVQKDLFEVGLKPSSVDLILNCSAIEHVGLGRYGDIEGSNGDLEAMRLMRRILKPGGLMLLTIPVGVDAVHQPLHRVYGTERLPRLLEGYEVQRKQFWLKDEQNRWKNVAEEVALHQPSRPALYGLGCFVLEVPDENREGRCR